MKCISLLSCITMTIGMSLVAEDAQISIDEQLKKIEVGADAFQQAINNLVLKPDLVITKEYISTPQIEKKYSAAIKQGSPFGKLTEAQSLITSLSTAKLDSTQKDLLKAAIESIQISLTNLLIIADTQYLVQIISNSLFNRKEFIQQRNAALANFNLYNPNPSSDDTVALQPFIDLGISADIAYPTFNNTYIEALATTKKTASNEKLKKALSAVSAQAMAHYFGAMITQANRDIGIGIVPEEIKATLQAVINKSTQTNQAPVDQKILRAEFDKLKPADQKSLFSVLLYKPATNLDIVLTNAQKALDK